MDGIQNSPSVMDRIHPSRKEAFSGRLADWYDPARRPFPWRFSSDPYYVAICETMLQRTNAEKVDNVAKDLFARYPRASDLATSSREDVELLLRPLGLPRRVDQIREIAAAFAQVEAMGCMLSKDELESLPGIGPYASAAVRILAYGECDALIDEHVLRILRRVFSVRAPARRHPTIGLVEFARSLAPCERTREYNLAVLDLGRLICRPTSPRCDECPLNDICDFSVNRDGVD